uniref:TIR domain-containing protein n=1 Tax=Amazona collaria TaxID=241587 RepID=A0A8B9F914_9PSIT
MVLAVSLSGEQEMKQTCPSCDTTEICNCSSMGLDFIPPGLTAKTTVLNLAHNRIKHIQSQDLWQAVNLRALLLQSNKISSIDEDSFRSLGKLELLDLSNNSLAHLSPVWFGHLFSLQHLYLQGNSYRDLGRSSLFSNLRNLSSLHLGNPGFSTIRQGNFEGVVLLDQLWIDGGNLSQYEPGSLELIRKINHMIINIKSISIVSAIVRDLLHSVAWLEVRKLDLSELDETQLLRVMSNCFANKLSFKESLITDATVPDIVSVIADMPKLEEVELIDCRLLGTGRWKMQIHVNQSQTIKVMTIEKLSIEQFYLFTDLQNVQGLLSLLTKITVQNTKVFLVPCRLSQHLRSLEYLDLSSNLLGDQSLKHSACQGGWPILQTLNLSQNSLSDLEMTGKSLSHLRHLILLDISQNNFGDIPDVCKWPKTLKYLNLSRTQIRKVTTCIPPTLEVLDVSANNLKEFGLQLPFLKELYLTRNQLKTLPDAAPIPNLVAMSVRSNKLNSFSKEELEGAQVGAVHLSLMECHRSLVVSLICSLLFLVILSLVAVGYKCHAVWYLRMTWAWLQAKRKPRRAPPKDLCYDAFVSYSENDSDWVENIMVQELEQACPPFRLCLHKRDFVPGKWIVDNIIDSIEKSHKTLFVLSEHFVQSEWCRYELDFSHFRLFDENNDAVILILLEPIQSQAIPKRFCKLRKIMNTKTYLEWPSGEEQQEMFWENLKGALKM